MIVDQAAQILRGRIVAAARGWLGTPYLHQASLKGVGCDCLGLLRGVWRDVMGPEPQLVPPYAADWAGQGRKELLAEASAAHLVAIEVVDATQGDVVLFRWRRHLPAMHCGILVGPDVLIHAHEGVAVAQVPLPGAWARRAAFAFAFPVPAISNQEGQG